MNTGALKKGWVNIAVHGHSPLLVSEIVRVGNSDEYQEKARAAGAEGIQFYGIFAVPDFQRCTATAE